MAAGRCERICTHSEAKTVGRWPGVKKGSKEPLFSKKPIRDRLIFYRKYGEWTAEDWGKVIFSDEASFRLFGASGKRLVRRRKGERYHQSCVMPTVKHPETIHVWGCFSSKGVGSLTILPKNTAMNKEWYQNSLQQQLLPTIQQQFGEEQCIFQHDGAPCHKAKVMTKWLGDQNVEILGPWPGILIPLIICGQSSRGGRTNKSPLILTNSKK
uniref:Tc1-like transposase DDE domain-containing protein n=1 Tax=Oreochromis aureus TaxID=47969 RepID=A0AAZ1XW34_OREAU